MEGRACPFVCTFVIGYIGLYSQPSQCKQWPFAKSSPRQVHLRIEVDTHTPIEVELTETETRRSQSFS
jgi:hypothetical protein